MISQKYLDILTEMADTHRKKSAGYSGADSPDPWRNFRGSEAFGVPAYLGALVRASDKFSRAQSLLRDIKNEQLGESLRDTLLDGAAYLIIASILYDEDAAQSAVDAVTTHVVFPHD